MVPTVIAFRYHPGHLSMIWGIRIRDFNQHVRNSFAKFEVIPGCDSEDMLHYVKQTLETKYYGNPIVNVRVNDLLNDKSPNNTENLTSNLLNIVKKCKLLGVENLFVFGIAFNKRLPYSFIKKTNEKFENMSKTHEIIFIDNGSISDMFLYQDKLRLLERSVD